MTTSLYYNPFVPAFSNIGVPIAEAYLYFYYTSTSTLAPIFSDAAGLVPLTNPVQANLAGKYPAIYMQNGVTYRVHQTDSLGVTLGDDIDPYYPGTVSVASDPTLRGDVDALSVPTIAALRAVPYAALTNNRSAFVEGYYAQGDGGGGPFYWSSASTATDDGGSVIKPTSNAGAGRWLRIVEGAVSTAAFGSIADNLTDNLAAFDAAWAYIKLSGGEITIPPGSYYLNGTWVLTADITFVGSRGKNYKISGYGATLFAGPSVTGPAVQLAGSFQYYGITVEGLTFNHRNNTTVGGCIDMVALSNCHILNCGVFGHNTPAGYKAIRVRASNPANANTNAFWTIIEGFHTRQLAGGDGTAMAIGVSLEGQANATTIQNCRFTSVVDAIKQTAPVGQNIPNSCRFVNNCFEGVVNAFTQDTANAATFGGGNYFGFNRYESISGYCYNFIGVGGLINYVEPFFEGEYYSIGSVNAIYNNPNNYSLSNWSPGLQTTNPPLRVSSPGDVTLNLGYNNRGNLVVREESGVASPWIAGHLVLGGYHFWPESGSNGATFRVKNGTPASDTDGQRIGALSGNVSLTAATTATVTLPSVEPNTSYRITLGQSATSTSPPWVTAKTTGGFTINFSAAFTGNVDWVLIR